MSFPLFDAATWALLYTASEWLVRLAMLVFVPMRRSPAAAKGWLLFILFLPWPGLVVFLVLGQARLPRWRREQLRRLPGVLAPVIERLRSHPIVFHPDLGIELGAAVHLAENLGRLPILGGNAAEMLPRYEGVIDRLTADIDAARGHVHLLFYIYADDATTRPVTEALCRAALRGVRCRVLIDAVGSRSWRKTLMPKLEAAGVAVHETLPVGLWTRKATARFDLRNHRKVAVIDGRIGYTGSQNLVAAKYREDLCYEELMVRLTGPGVLELQFVFVADWFLETDEVLDTLDVFPGPQVTGPVPVQVLPSGPQYPTQTTQRLLVALLYGARRRVVVTTPYFVPDEALCQAMETAVRRNVEVHLVVSAKKDQLLVGLAQESYYEELLEHGVRIHLFRENFLHAKHVSIDDDIVLVGSSNMDNRSFSLNAEASLLIYDRQAAAALRLEQDRCLACCDPLRRDEWARRSGVRKAAQNVARLFSPLL
jgi:cardiolipin synthase